MNGGFYFGGGGNTGLLDPNAPIVPVPNTAQFVKIVVVAAVGIWLLRSLVGAAKGNVR